MTNDMLKPQREFYKSIIQDSRLVITFRFIFPSVSVAYPESERGEICTVFPRKLCFIGRAWCK